MARVPLVLVDPVILSAYPIGAERGKLIPLRDTAEGLCVPEMASALLILQAAVLAKGGDFRVTSMTRDLKTQAAAYARYQAWVKAGRPPVTSPKYDPDTMKADVVARPGYSWHNAGRAVDISIKALRFPGVAADKQLDLLWDLARPLGFRPILKTPEERASEAWHFDFMGPWAGLFQRRGDYAEAAMAACLDVGGSGYGRDVEREIQAHLHRLGIDVGAIDGLVGTKTRTGLHALDLDEYAIDMALLQALRTR